MICCRIIVTKLLVNGTKTDDVKILVLNLGNKTNYVRNLPLYFSLGMNLTITHKILKFKQFDLMKIYIDFNTEK